MKIPTVFRWPGNGKRSPLIFLTLCLFILQWGIAASGDRYYEKSIYSDEYGLSFYPDYPPLIGQSITLRLRTFIPAEKVTLYSDREELIPLLYRDGHWWGKFTIPADYKEGGHFFTVCIRYPYAFLQEPDSGAIQLLKKIGLMKKNSRSLWTKSTIWYQAFRTPPVDEAISSPPELLESGNILESGTNADLPPSVTGEAVTMEIISPEALPLLIKGSQNITFRSRMLVGSKEGYTAGTQNSREEALRINISGRAAETDINATLIRTTSLGLSELNDRNEKISILLKRGSLEVYLGDFTADFNETEFSRLQKTYSGATLKGNYGNWGFKALYSSPRGESKYKRMYGNGTQGPYRLDFAPVVIDSERVLVDGEPQTRGDNYSIDYQAGTITFKNSVINIKSIIQVYYDYRQTVYQHITYGLRLTADPFSQLQLGATYLRDEDSLLGAREIRSSMSQEAVNPQSHSVFGADGSFASQQLNIDGEIAYSAKNFDLLSLAGSEETGKAALLNVNASLGPFELFGHAKGVGTYFYPLAEPNPKQNLREYSGRVAFRPGSFFGAGANYTYQKYFQDAVLYANKYKAVSCQLVPAVLPSLEYNFQEADESNDPVSGASINRIITKNYAQAIYQLGFLSASVRGGLENWVLHSPALEATDYKKINLGIATIGLDKISFASNAEYEKRNLPAGLAPSKKTYNINLSANPSRPLFLSSAINIIDDSQLGYTNVTDVACRFEPFTGFKADAKYTVASVAEDFTVTSETVAKHAGSVSLDYRPIQNLRLRYLLKPNYTVVLRNSAMSYNNEQTQSEINFIPIPETMLGVIYKTTNLFNAAKNDYPNYSIAQDTEKDSSVLYTLKAAPFQILSLELNYLLENGKTSTLVSTLEPYSYTPGQSIGRKINLLTRTALTEKFSLDSRYTYQKSDEGTGESSSDSENITSHTFSLKGNWNYSETLTLALTGAYSRTSDDILGQVTYTLSPGFGFIYHLADRLRIDFTYAYSKSFSGSETIKNTAALKTKYSLSNYVNLLLRVDHETGLQPAYRLTDITANVEINL